PIFSSGDEMLPKSISFDIATDAKQRVTCLNRHRLETALVNVAAPASSMRAGPIVGVSSFEPMHQCREICDPLADHDEVPVIAHDLVRNNFHMRLVERLAQDPGERIEIAIGFEQRGSADRTVHDVKRHSAEGVTRSSGHEYLPSTGRR